ncbi:unnamed protein product [Heterobilharzia americana]|nr:unnamed protein product [Heterobilharzia americana]
MGKLLSLNWVFLSENVLYKLDFFSPNLNPNEVLHNISSDECIIQLLNSRRQGGFSCILSKKCVTSLLNFKSHGYELAHQILYILIAFQVNCTNSLENILSSISVNLEELRNQLCLVLYTDLVNSFSSVRMIPSNRDVVLEEIFVCGNLGYGKFIQPSILDEILSWQRPSGCFSVSDYEIVENGFGNTLTSFTKRRTLVERRHADGCLSHMTSVGTAVLGLYLRAFFFPRYIYSSDKNLINLYAVTRKIVLTRSYDSLPPLLEDNYEKSKSLKYNMKKQTDLDRLMFFKGSQYMFINKFSTNFKYSPNFNHEVNILNSIYPLIVYSPIFCFICFSISLYLFSRCYIFRRKLSNLYKFTVET